MLEGTPDCKQVQAGHARAGAWSVRTREPARN
jgi:hypothetical protein